MPATTFTILGEPASKANSRELGMIRIPGTDKQRPHIRKSDKALEYEESAQRQIPPRSRLMLAGRVRVTMHMFYASERPDMDESVVLDVLQAKYKRQRGQESVCIARGVYINDRQVRERHIYHHIDKHNPRVEITVESIDGEQAEIVQTKVIHSDQVEPDLFKA